MGRALPTSRCAVGRRSKWMRWVVLSVAVSATRSRASCLLAVTVAELLLLAQKPKR